MSTNRVDLWMPSAPVREGAMATQVGQGRPDSGVVGGHDGGFDPVVAERPEQGDTLDGGHRHVECGDRPTLGHGHDIDPHLGDLLVGGVFRQPRPAALHGGLSPCVVHGDIGSPGSAEAFSGAGVLAFVDESAHLFFGDLTTDVEQRRAVGGPPSGCFPTRLRVGVVGHGRAFRCWPEVVTAGDDLLHEVPDTGTWSDPRDRQHSATIEDQHGCRTP
jgi:hypothetical protein